MAKGFTTINLVNVDYAENHPGKEASVLKWKRIVKALDIIETVSEESCGLCVEFIRDCRKCSYGKCLEHGSFTGSMKDFHDSLQETRDFAEQIQSELEDIKKGT